MRFYCLHHSYDNGASAGYEYFGVKSLAEKAQRQWMRDHPGEEIASNEITIIEIAPSRTGILAALNKHADHPDNG